MAETLTLIRNGDEDGNDRGYIDEGLQQAEAYANPSEGLIIIDVERKMRRTEFMGRRQGIPHSGYIALQGFMPRFE